VQLPHDKKDLENPPGQPGIFAPVCTGQADPGNFLPRTKAIEGQASFQSLPAQVSIYLTPAVSLKMTAGLTRLLIMRKTVGRRKIKGRTAEAPAAIAVSF
jgi:hypothetical protein